MAGDCSLTLVTGVPDDDPLKAGPPSAADRIISALNFARVAPPIGAYRRIPGLHVTATDMAWHAGYGPEVRGPAEAILLVTAGRSVALEDLSGPGVPALRRRMDG